MNFTALLGMSIVCALGAMSPGPSLAVVLRNTISGGRTQGVLTGDFRHTFEEDMTFYYICKAVM